VVSVVKLMHDNGLTIFKEFQILVGDSKGHAGHSVSSEASQIISKGSKEGIMRKGRGLPVISKKEELVSLICHCTG